MPPKKQDKNKGKEKKPVVDKTFGMKNKNRSAKVQQQVKIIKQQESQKGKNKESLNKEKEKEALAAKKAAEAKRKLELEELFKSVDIVQPKVPPGTDPKSVLCAFFKAGKCQKGSKCKFSHDLEQNRRSEKLNVYEDSRSSDKKNETSENWSEEQLRSVVNAKGSNRTTTDIVCKYFIDAVEQGRYGWFWECPNGGVNCQYRHALPPGFVLKKDKKKAEEDAKNNELSLEEFLEVERHKLDSSKLTPITKESFAEWKKQRIDRKAAEQEVIRKGKETLAAAGRATGMSGRDLFTYNPQMLMSLNEDDDDDQGWDDLATYREQTELERQQREEERIRQLETGVASISV